MKKILVVLALVIVTISAGYFFVCSNAEESYDVTVTDAVHDYTEECYFIVNGEEMTVDEYYDYIQNN